MARRLVVIGGDAGGMGTATQARRLDADLEIVALERSDWTSYSACGIPYVVAGQIPALDDLVVRTPQEFRDRHRIDVRTRHEAMAIDTELRRVEVRDHVHGRTFHLGYDDLLIGTGARPVRPDLPGIDLPFVRGVQTLDDASALLEHAGDTTGQRAVVVGGGYIGLEMAEAFSRRGAEVTLVERSPHVMATLDDDMAVLVENAITRFGIDLRTDTAVEGFDPGKVHTAVGTLDADIVVLGLGVQPNSELAGAAGLELGVRDAIRVDRRQRTSAEDVWAAGDCAEAFHLVSQRPTYIALGTVANRQARVAGTNIGGGYARFPGIIGTAATRICSTEVSRTGLNEREAADAAIEVVSSSVDSTTTAGYLPDAPKVTVKLLTERGTGRLVGGQIVGGDRSAKRIDVIATAITAGMTAGELYECDLAYAPPFSPLWDPVLVAARAAAARS